MCTENYLSDTSVCTLWFELNIYTTSLTDCLRLTENSIAHTSQPRDKSMWLLQGWTVNRVCVTDWYKQKGIGCWAENVCKIPAFLLKAPSDHKYVHEKKKNVLLLNDFETWVGEEPPSSPWISLLILCTYVCQYCLSLFLGSNSREYLCFWK